MADIHVNKPIPTIEEPSGVFIDPVDYSPVSIEPPAPTEADVLKGMFDAAEALPDYAKGGSLKVNQTTYVDLKPSLRYNDPIMGYDPFNSNLENQYAREYWGQNILHNIAGFATKMYGTLAEGLASIPLALSGIGRDDYMSYIFRGENDLSRWIHNFIKEVDENLPVYRTNYEDNHPIAKYFNILDPVSMVNAYGSTLNQLGFTVGALGAGVIEGALLTASTQGVGLPAALARVATRLTTAISRISRMSSTTPRILRLGSYATRGLRITEAPVMVGRVGGPTMDIIRAQREFDKLRKIVRTTATINKINNKAIQQISLITSARAESVFEASESYEATLHKLLSEYKNRTGEVASGEDYLRIDAAAKEAAAITASLNMPILYLSNAIGWGSLFRPTKLFVKGTGITGWGKNIGKLKIKETVAKGKVIREVIKDSPKNVISNVFLHTQRIGKSGVRGFSEGIEEGLQFTSSTAAQDYSINKYNAPDRVATISLLTSLAKGFKETVSTNEGLENVMGGFMGGLLGGGAIGRVMNRKALSKEQELKQQVESLNSSQISDIFSVDFMIESLSDPTFISPEGIRGKIEAMTHMVNLSKKYQEALAKGNIKEAKDIRTDMAIAHWISSKRSNTFQARLEEMDMLRQLEGESFTEHWGLEYNSENKKRIDSFLDTQIDLANQVSDSYDSAIGFAGKNPYNKKKDPVKWKARELAVEDLTRTGVRVEDATRRIRELRDNLKGRHPFFEMNLDRVLQIVSPNGLRDISSELNAEINSINTLIEALPKGQPSQTLTDLENQAKRSDYIRHRDKLIELKESLDEMIKEGVVESINSFNGRKYLDVIKNLFIHRVSSFNPAKSALNETLTDQLDQIISETGVGKQNYTDEDIAAILTELQDMYTLAQDQLNYQRLYNLLRSKDYFDAHAEKLNKQLEERQKLLADFMENLEKNGIDPFVQEDEAENIRQEEYEKIDHPEDLSTEDKENIREASRKPVDEWSEEEAASVAANPEVFNQYEEAESRAQERITEKNTQTAATWLNNTKSQSVKNEGYSGITPDILLQGIYLNGHHLTDSELNLYNALFNEKAPIEELVHHLQAVITQRTSIFIDNDITSSKEKGLIRTASEKDPSEWTKEEKAIDEKYPGVIEEYRQESADYRSRQSYIEYRDPLTGAVTRTKLIRTHNHSAVEVRFKQGVIGELRDPKNVLYKDEDGNLIRVIDEAGRFVLTPQQYADATGNGVDTYNDFKTAVESYTTSYNTVVRKLNNGENLEKGDLAAFFQISINPGFVNVTNVKPSEHSKDVNLNDITQQNVILLTIQPDPVSGEVTASSISELKTFGYNKEQAERIIKSIKENAEHVKQLGRIRKPGNTNAYQVAVLPLADGIVTSTSFIRARVEGLKSLKNSKDLTKDKVTLPTTNPNVIDNARINFLGRVNPANPSGPKPTTPPKKPSPKADFFKKLGVNYNYNGKTFSLEFESDIDKAVFLLFRLNDMGKTSSEMYGRLLNFITESFEIQKGVTYTEAQLLTIAEKNLVKPVVNKSLDSIPDGVNKFRVPSTLWTTETVNKAPNPYEIVEGVNNLSKMGQSAQKEIRSKEPATSKTYKAIEEVLIKMGFTFKRVKEQPKTRKAGVIYIVDDSYFAYSLVGDTKLESEVRRIGVNPTEQTTDGNGINTYSLWKVYETIISNKTQNTVPKTPSTEQQQSDELAALEGTTTSSGNAVQTPSETQEQHPAELQETIDAINNNDSLTPAEKARAIKTQTERYYAQQEKEQASSQTEIETQKDDIERKRKEAKDAVWDDGVTGFTLGLGVSQDVMDDFSESASIVTETREEWNKIIDAKYNADINALESKTTTSSGNAVQTPSGIETQQQASQEQVQSEQVKEREEETPATTPSQKAVLFTIANKADLVKLLSSGLFGKLSKKQAEAFSELVDMWVKARVVDGQFEDVAEGYAYFKFGGIELFKQIVAERNEKASKTEFTEEEFPDITDELNEVRKEHGAEPIIEEDEFIDTERDPISDEVWEDFQNTNTVPTKILNAIADKVNNNYPLSPRETYIQNNALKYQKNSVSLQDLSTLLNTGLVRKGNCK